MRDELHVHDNGTIKVVTVNDDGTPISAPVVPEPTPEPERITAPAPKPKPKAAHKPRKG